MLVDDLFARTRLLLGQDGLDRLAAARVAVFGIGGVGGYAVEALARSGVGTLDLIDDDKVCLTNLNRQLEALHSTLGRPKAEAVAVLKEILAGRGPRAMMDMVILNVGVAMFLLEDHMDLAVCMAKAREAVCAGVGRRTLHVA